MPFLDEGGDTFGAGDPPHGLCIAPNDEALEPNPVWIRLDDPAEDWSLRVSQVSIDRGKSNELDTTKTGTMTVTFKDPDGLLDPTNTTSPFYDTSNDVTLLNPNVQVAFARFNPIDGTWSTRFRGFTKQWSYDLDTSGFATVTLQAVDLFELLADLLLTPGDQGDTPLIGNESDIYYEGGSPFPFRNNPIHVDDRIEQVLVDAGLPGFWYGSAATPIGVFSGNVQVQEQTLERFGQIIDALFAAADAEFPGVANIFCRKEGTIQFFGRFARFFPDRPGYHIDEWDVGGAAEAAADTNVVRLSSFKFRRSKDDIFNRALALPQGLEEGDVPGQQVDDATSQAKYGIRPWFAEDLLTWQGHDDLGNTVDAATETKKFATYRVNNYKNPKNRIEQIRFRMLGVDHTSAPAVWSFLQEVEIGDVLNVLTSHRGGGGFDEQFYVEGIREVDEPLDGTMHNVTMQIDVSPKSFFDSNPFGELDMGES